MTNSNDSLIGKIIDRIDRDVIKAEGFTVSRDFLAHWSALSGDIAKAAIDAMCEENRGKTLPSEISVVDILTRTKPKHTQKDVDDFLGYDVVAATEPVSHHQMPDGRKIFGEDSPHDIGEHLKEVCAERPVDISDLHYLIDSIQLGYGVALEELEKGGDIRQFLKNQTSIDWKSDLSPKREIGNQEKLWNHCIAFIKAQKIGCAEIVCQSDRVIENAYDFIVEIGEIVGWYNTQIEGAKP